MVYEHVESTKKLQAMFTNVKSLQAPIYLRTDLKFHNKIERWIVYLLSEIITALQYD